MVSPGVILCLTGGVEPTQDIPLREYPRADTLWQLFDKTHVLAGTSTDHNTSAKPRSSLLTLELPDFSTLLKLPYGTILSHSLCVHI